VTALDRHGWRRSVDQSIQLDVVLWDESRLDCVGLGGRLCPTFVLGVLRPVQHSIGYMGDGFYRSKDPTNSIKVLKENIQRKNQTTQTA